MDKHWYMAKWYSRKVYKRCTESTMSKGNRKLYTNTRILVRTRFRLDYPTRLSFSESINCLEYITPDYTHTLKWILWGNWTVSFLVTLIGIIYMYRIWVQHKMLLDQWPYNQIVYKIPLQKFKGIIPVTWVWLILVLVYDSSIFSLIKFGLFCKIVPSLVIDVMDIFFDTMYFNEMVTNKVLDPSIHISTHVYIIIFTFQITGNLI